MTKRRSIIYVNFAPYDNAGKILDFLVENFYVVIHFSYDHLRLKRGRRSKLTVYENRTPIFKKNLIWLRTHKIFLFPSLPLVALLIIGQSLWHIFRLKNQYKKFDIYLTVNAFTAWSGNIFRKLNLVDKTIFWVWDYFPQNYPDWRLQITRWVYWKFDKPALLFSDKIVFLNRQLKIARENHEKKIIDKEYTIIPIGTNPSNQAVSGKKIIIGHLGMLKKGQGLDLLFDNLKTLLKLFPQARVEIVGSGPEEDHFKTRARRFQDKVRFYGFVEKDDEVDNIVRNWSIGIATYMPEKWSEHYWTDPSKIKAYLSQGVPVITTNVPEFAKEVESYNAGIVVDYYRNAEFIEAISKILKDRKKFSDNAFILAKKYNYKVLYPKIFT